MCSDLVNLRGRERVPLPWDHNMVTAYPSFVEIANPFLEHSGCRISPSGSVSRR